MRLDMISNQSQPLQNSENIKRSTELNQSVMQENTLRSHGTNFKKDEAENLVNKINETLEPVNRNIQFKLHEKLNEYYVEVVNPNTDEVIREIPPKKLLDLYAATMERIGLLVDEKL
ncbi:flagellar protein FlaG [Ornithinibacillus halophilus]|uniref:Flagellar protein FlaG n=1 Tax=Ornithinibacillus halophilus TaxID=930117 RepID=A0A1M5FC85_9BACI|nr:flagellar protein FlaG [Ornithinibacillus halophilus]SHF89155.1 flagellar protein FlaG [Ornithinibacillus halophilus]